MQLSQIGMLGLWWLLGSGLGSIWNMLYYQLTTGEKFYAKKIYCVSCKTAIPVRDMIPVFSWILLRGKCRSCHSVVSSRHLVIELLGGIIGVSFGIIIMR
jgi:leader peptidase (prepilin peptidase)/N-methyltransferase